MLKAEKSVLFLQNKEIDHLYSLSLSTETTQNAGQFTMNSIRMKSSLGLAGKAFTSGKIVNEADTKGDQNPHHLIAEEKDLGKLKLSGVSNAVAIPVLDKQNGMPQAVLVVYNYNREEFERSKLHVDADKSQQLLWDMSSMVSSILFNVENLQGLLGNNDALEASFNLVNDGVILLNAEQAITKMNKSAEILLNTSSQVAAGKNVTEALTSRNSHFMTTIAEVAREKPFSVLMKTQITTSKGSGKSGEETE